MALNTKTHELLMSYMGKNTSGEGLLMLIGDAKKNSIKVHPKLQAEAVPTAQGRMDAVDFYSTFGIQAEITNDLLAKNDIWYDRVGMLMNCGVIPGYPDQQTAWKNFHYWMAVNSIAIHLLPEAHEGWEPSFPFQYSYPREFIETLADQNGYEILALEGIPSKDKKFYIYYLVWRKTKDAVFYWKKSGEHLYGV